MRWFNAFNLATKLGIAFSTVLILTVCVGTLSIWELAQVNDTSDRLSSRWMPSIRVIEDIKAQVARIRTRELQYILSSDVKEMDQYDAVIAKDLDDLHKMQSDYESLLTASEDRMLYEQFKELWTRYMIEDAKIRAAGRDNKDELGKALLRGESNRLIVALRQKVDALVNFYSDGGRNAAIEGHRRYLLSRTWIITLVTGGVILGSLGAALITRWLMRGLGGEPDYATAIVGRIAAGDLSVQVQTRDGDTASLLYAMRTMRNNLATIVGDVRGATHVIASASGLIAEGNLDLSSRTENQASSLEQTAASMEELTSTVRQNSASAAKANELASSASQIAQKGSEVVGRVVDTMESINNSSRQIADIITVIDSIAFQTNILALNAAVEAARAGEQGRGFAVVATEVRNLAQRSASAAKEIKELINNSVGNVDTGSKLVAQAGSTMQDVVASVENLTGLMAEITNAGKEQTAGIEQVNQAIAQMDSVTQQNANLVQQATHSAQSMQEQAASLAKLVSIFNLETPKAGSHDHAAIALGDAYEKRAFSRLGA